MGEFSSCLAREGGYKSCLAFFSQVGGSRTVAPKMRAQLGAAMREHPDRLWALSVIAPQGMVREYEADGFLVFEDPTRAVVALHAMGRFGDAFAAPPPSAPPAVRAVELPRESPAEAEAKRVLAEAGIPPVPERACATAEAAVAAAREFAFPVVMKILSPDIPHKSEIGGVLLDVADEAGVREGFATLLARAAERASGARVEGVLVARQISGAVEIAMGLVRDPAFGPVAMVGLGGVFVEVFRDAALRRCPFGEREAEAMIRSLRGFPLLDGARGRPKADVAALARALARLSVFGASQPRLRSADVNPVMALPEGQGCFAADAVLEPGD